LIVDPQPYFFASGCRRRVVTVASDATSVVPGSMAVVGLAYPLAAGPAPACMKNANRINLLIAELLAVHNSSRGPF
jgi:hypothetical protein